MNLIKAKKLLRSAIDNFNDNDLGFQIEIEDNHVNAKAGLSIAGHDDGVVAFFQVYENGSAFFRFLFDNIDQTLEALQLTEEFNENVLFLKADIGDGILTISCNCPCVTEDSLEDLTLIVLNEIIDDDTTRYLKPLTELTYSN